MNRDDDDLGPARGILSGVAAGLLIWAVAAAIIFALGAHWQ